MTDFYFSSLRTKKVKTLSQDILKYRAIQKHVTERLVQIPFFFFSVSASL